MQTNALVRRSGWLEVIRFGWQLPRLARLLFRLMADGRVSRPAKVLLIGGVLYVLSPFDFLADVVPVLGQLDDVALLALVARAFLGLCPPAALAEHAAGPQPAP